MRSSIVWMKVVTFSFLVIGTFYLAACQADVGPYVVDVQQGPSPGTIKVIKCKTTVTDLGNMTAVENNGDCTVTFIDVGVAPAPRAAHPTPAPASAPAPTPSTSSAAPSQPI